MPRILVTEAEKAELLKQREVRALQALAWNEAIQHCLDIYYSHSNTESQDEIPKRLEALRRPTNGLT